MRAHPYLLAAIMMLLAACSDATGPNLSTSGKNDGSASAPGGVVRTPGGHQVPAK